MKNGDKNKSVAFIILVSIFKYHNIFGSMVNIKVSWDCNSTLLLH